MNNLQDRNMTKEVYNLSINLKNIGNKLDMMVENQNVMLSQMQTIKQKEKRMLTKVIDNRLFENDIRLDSLVVAREYIKNMLLVNGKYENITLDSDLALMTDSGRIQFEMFIVDIIIQMKKVHPSWFLD